MMSELRKASLLYSKVKQAEERLRMAKVKFEKFNLFPNSDVIHK